MSWQEKSGKLPVADLFGFDSAYREAGFHAVCGVDEAGRGPLAGPVYAAAVVLPTDAFIDGLNDSKKLSEKKRERLYGDITRTAVFYHVAFAAEAEIDEINILNASLLAMRRAVNGLGAEPDIVLADGNFAPESGIFEAAVVQGDARSACIAAASILAKVSRDAFMLEIDKKYPEYKFFAHKGYPTKLHYEMLDKYGPSPIHRKSFLKKWEKSRGKAGCGL